MNRLNHLDTRSKVGLGALALFLLAVAVLAITAPETAGDVFGLIDGNLASAALRTAVPIAFAALGGLFAEKSGVINIGLEGLLIVSAFAGAASIALLTGDPGSASQSMVWVGFLIGVLASVLLSLLFAVVTIDLEADQIIAGLAVWLIALGLGPFAAQVLFSQFDSPSVSTLNTVAIPGLSQLPVVGPILFDANPTVYMLLVAVPASWYFLYHTAFGQWIRASGENPKALDTAGIDVRRVRYGSVLLSGALTGIGGAALSLVLVGKFTGGGATIVNGRGFIAITAYLFGNYNPVGAFGASLLFATLEALQFRLQILGIGIPKSLIQMIPFVLVIVVLALVGRTRLPAAAGEHYDSGED
ncbi:MULTISPECIES: ABC transporter permease [unclassified Haladaptatus]|uniref:ABC transporter permease n=1 Tax=unclassified Haladaptatus TaxID=2622732 RepID=UPI0023E7561C|nr:MULTISPECIES: ABC transporter permease [unclassified Haladaptatus]